MERAFKEEGWRGSQGCLLGSREVRTDRVSGHRQEKGLERWQGQTMQGLKGGPLSPFH